MLLRNHLCRERARQVGLCGAAACLLLVLLAFLSQHCVEPFDVTLLLVLDRRGELCALVLVELVQLVVRLLQHLRPQLLDPFRLGRLSEG